MKTIVLTGGGTAGHVLPALAIVPELKKKFDRICYIGGSGVEKTLAMDAELPYFETETAKFRRSLSLKNFAIPFKLIKGVKEATEHLKRLKPAVVFGKGGYVSLPSVIAAKKLGIPVVVHESDFSLGLANKIAEKHFGAKVLTAYPETAAENPSRIFVGFPLRDSLFTGQKERAARFLEFDGSRPVLLVVGGSSGSVAINEAVKAALPKLLETYDVVHVMGKNSLRYSDSPHYKPIAYSEAIENLYALADVVVSRAGAGAVSELSALEKSAVLIPLPAGASRGDQLDNAYYAKKYGAVVLEQADLSTLTLLSAIAEAKSVKMRPMSPPANKKIADILFAVANGNVR